ncbi:hypothetical protein HMPREF9004_1538 [Schaalia cardiffensis F0333]|uniref:Uncharacterized protein n=1 Tax=Schaalia cardiffensis F0333 TaxID=888050 RepID=N6X907_9ACTO|nr:hypothetical protein HMPREF9004_1538 [Schaalia cardiffensis F0333]
MMNHGPSVPNALAKRARAVENGRREHADVHTSRHEEEEGVS